MKQGEICARRCGDVFISGEYILCPAYETGCAKNNLLTARQSRRQSERSYRSGRYEPYPRCEICGKTLRHGEYCSDERVDDVFKGCGNRLAVMSDAEALVA